MKKYFLLSIIFLLSFGPQLFAELVLPREDSKSILPLRQRVKITEKWWRWKHKHILPKVMREQGIDLWIIRDDEADLYYNNQGPVYVSLLKADHQGMAYPSRYARPGSQRLPRFLMFYDQGKRIENIEPRDYAHITQLVIKKKPKRIAIAQHNNQRMRKALRKRYAARSVDSWTLGVRWLETVGEERVSIYHHVQRVANEVIAEAFSNKVVIPDVTTTEDLNWWILHKYVELGLDMENYPTVTVQRKDKNLLKYDDPAEFFNRGRNSNGNSVVIRRGDIVSCDTDLYMYGLITDSHQHAYVLEAGETGVPAPLKEALLKVNRMQDMFRQEFKVGRTGKEIVAAANKIKRLEGIIESELGFHPGYYPTSIVTNNHKLYYNTLYAFEPHTRVAVPGWKYGVELGIGQITIFTKKGLNYLARPQESQWHIIK